MSWFTDSLIKKQEVMSHFQGHILRNWYQKFFSLFQVKFFWHYRKLNQTTVPWSCYFLDCLIRELTRWHIDKFQSRIVTSRCLSSSLYDLEIPYQTVCHLKHWSIESKLTSFLTCQRRHVHVSLVSWNNTSQAILVARYFWDIIF